MVKRYITNFNIDNIRKEYCDVIIVGTGIAGLYTSLNINSKYKVIVLSKDKITENNSNLAQGGIAACLSLEDDIKSHFKDTVKAGNFYNDEKAVLTLVEEASKNIKKLVNIGTNFDRDEEGNLKVTREGGHSKRRVLHSKDETGKEIIRSLSQEVLERRNITVLENTFAIDLLTVNNKCLGVLVRNEQEKYAILSKATVLATGGIGQVYKNTTNSIIATGDGIAMAYRAGAEIIDMEFVQFHPTALYSENDNKRFLISEAVRGEGAVLRNSEGEAFMEKYHELKDLAPRDIAAQSIFNEMINEDKPCVFLDITHKDEDYIKNRFPNIYRTCLSKGIDMTKEYIPVCPVQHYIMGGIKTDYYGKTNIQRLYACGETACTGVHGANRLASNSLLEGLVFGKRVADKINNDIDNEKIENYSIKNQENFQIIDEVRINEIKVKVKETMGRYVFILRSKAGLRKALNIINEILNELNDYKVDTKEFYECINIATVAYLVIKAALNREKSLGSHTIVDGLEGDSLV